MASSDTLACFSVTSTSHDEHVLVTDSPPVFNVEDELTNLFNDLDLLS